MFLLLCYTCVCDKAVAFLCLMVFASNWPSAVQHKKHTDFIGLI